MIVQSYKSQVRLAGTLMPILLGGGNLEWDKNFDAPQPAGNYWPQAFIEGFQTPAVTLQFLLLNNATVNPLQSALMQYWFDRASDYTHDVPGIDGLDFFDGFSGWSLPAAKAHSFTISGSKGQRVGFSSVFMLYQPDANTPPVEISSPLDGSYTPISGAPINYRFLNFARGDGSGLDGVVSFEMTMSNNMTPDPSMQAGTGDPTGSQALLPVDCNAGVMTARLRVRFQANAVNHINDGDGFQVRVKTSLVDRTFKAVNIAPSTQKGRTIGVGRQMREYMCDLYGIDNTAAGAPVSYS